MDSNRFNQMFGFVAVKLQGHFNSWGVDAPLLAENNNINPGTRADGGQKQVIGLRDSAVSTLVFGLIRFYRESFVGWIYLFPAWKKTSISIIDYPPSSALAARQPEKHRRTYL